MATSLEQFKASIRNEVGRRALDVQLPQAEADRVANDELLAQAYYENWRRTGLGAHEELLPEIESAAEVLARLRTSRDASRAALIAEVSQMPEREVRATLVASIESAHPPIAVSSEYPRTEQAGTPSKPSTSKGVPPLSRDLKFALSTAENSGVWGLFFSVAAWVVLFLGLATAMSQAGRPGVNAYGIFTAWAIFAALAAGVGLLRSIHAIKRGNLQRKANYGAKPFVLGIIGTSISGLLLFTLFLELLSAIAR